MATRGLYVFKHTCKLGNAPAHGLIERIQVELQAEVQVPRAFTDYTLNIQDSYLPSGVELISKA